MRNIASVTDVARRFADYINRVAYRGEVFVLVRGNKPVAELRPVPRGKQLKELSDLLGSLPHLSKEEALDFAHDLVVLRSEMADREELEDPWAS